MLNLASALAVEKLAQADQITKLTAKVDHLAKLVEKRLSQKTTQEKMTTPYKNYADCDQCNKRHEK